MGTLAENGDFGAGPQRDRGPSFSSLRAPIPRAPGHIVDRPDITKAGY